MHCEIREENDKVFFNTNYKTRVSFITACDDLHVVAHTKELPQLMSWKL